MKKEFFTVCLLMAFAVPVFAELTVEDTVDKEFMKNSGYSTATINAVQKLQAQHNGEALEEPVEHECYKNPAIKFIRRVFMYADPSLDDHTFVNDHEIHTSPRFDDL